MTGDTGDTGETGETGDTAPGADEGQETGDVGRRLADQVELMDRLRGQGRDLAAKQAQVLARSAEIHEDVARVHEDMPAHLRRITPEESREHARIDREGSQHEQSDAEHLEQGGA